ncbi:MAG: 2-oxo acid dehydrogenase subunit E2 [Acidobacteriota bacterium]|nr:2-oxo acid dehydrogenase subunit E2 [Acidobacteriota bacterium]
MANTIEIRVPEDHEEGTSATVGTWLNDVGDEVEKDEPLVELETDKVNVEVSAPADGTLVEILVEEGEEVGPGQVLGLLALDGEAAAHEPKTRKAEPAKQTPAKREPARGRGAEGDSLRMSPVVRRLLRDNGLTADQVRGTGAGGRITRDDVLDHVAKTDNRKAAAGFPKIQAPSRIVPHDKMRKSIAHHMVQSLLHTAPHVTAVFEMDMSAVIAHRKAHKEEFKARGVNLTFTAYFTAASVEALKKVPEANSSYGEDALEIFEDFNIGVGTALEDKGLIVPVIHKAQDLDLFGIAEKLQDLTDRAREGTLARSDVSNGTFTISNHGVSGTLIATPIIINQPQSAILGIGKLEKRVVVEQENGEDVMRIRPRAFVTLSIDHRVLDAWHTNTFLTKFVEVIENWS